MSDTHSNSQWSIKISRIQHARDSKHASYKIEVKKSLTHSRPGSVGVLVLLDVSPSLWGSGVWISKNLATALVRSLPNGVMLTVARFCGKPRLVYGPEVFDRERLDIAVDSIGSVRECKATNLAAALKHALELVSRYDRIDWNVIIISDFVPSVSRSEDKLLELFSSLSSISRVFLIPVGDVNRVLVPRLGSSSGNISVLWLGNSVGNMHNTLARILVSSGLYDSIPYEIVVGYPMWVSLYVFGHNGNDVIHDNGTLRVRIMELVMDSGIARILLMAFSYIEDFDSELVMPIVLRSIAYDGIREKVIGVIEFGLD